MVEQMTVTRIVATAAALDDVDQSDSGIMLRTAPDEMLVVAGTVPDLTDPHAIVVPDAGWAGAWLDDATANRLFTAACDWSLPAERPAFAQGMVAHLAAKVWLEADRTLVMVPLPLAAELASRLEEHR